MASHRARAIMNQIISCFRLLFIMFGCFWAGHLFILSGRFGSADRPGPPLHPIRSGHKMITNTIRIGYRSKYLSARRTPPRNTRRPTDAKMAETTSSGPDVISIYRPHHQPLVVFGIMSSDSSRAITSAAKRRACLPCTNAKSKCSGAILSSGICERCSRLGKRCIFLDMPERRRNNANRGSRYVRNHSCNYARFNYLGT